MMASMISSPVPMVMEHRQQRNAARDNLERSGGLAEAVRPRTWSHSASRQCSAQLDAQRSGGQVSAMPMRSLGHRGASADFPENTMEAFSGAMAQRADGVELDVMRCATGELVVCHDEWLDRLAGLHWEVLTTPWWKLRKADVGSRLGFAP